MKKFTPLQLFAMLICTRAFSMMTFLPESNANALELMLGTVLSTVFQIVIICCIAAFHKRFPNDDPCTLAVSRSKWAGRVVCGVYLVYFLAVSFYVIGNFTYFMDYYFSDYIPRLMIVLSITACGIYVGTAGLGVIGKTGTVLFALFLFVTATLVISSLENFTFVDFHLAEENVGKGIFHSAVSELARSSYLAVIVFLLPSIKGNAAKTSVYFLLTRLALVDIVLGFITMILGDYTLLAKLPFFALAAFSRTAIIERYDAAVMGVWVMLTAYKLGLYFHCSGRCLRYIFPKLGSDSGVIITAAIPAAATLFWLLPHKWESIIYAGLSSLPLIILGGVVPLLCLIFVKKGAGSSEKA